MKLPRDLGGERLVKALCTRWAYVQSHQSGSHIILDTEIPSRHRIAIPAHESLRIGTLNAILRSVAKHKGVSREALLETL
jgi:predicted RNA binding protein YcfA (HicA-like mRNA interferase family)